MPNSTGIDCLDSLDFDPDPDFDFDFDTDRTDRQPLLEEVCVFGRPPALGGTNL
ncbi:MAG: hypothetical protein PHF14_07010 [Verrucomicrobiota bacterium]|nr:hypothetical protein [Verrucomicrobiota bacterium]MDD8046192.1 hypothetical protein [Verrucomicrobiota bacterium]